MKYITSKTNKVKVLCRETCDQAKRIMPEDQLIFDNLQGGLKHGYRPGQCCLLKDYTFDEMSSFYKEAEISIPNAVKEWYIDNPSNYEQLSNLQKQILLKWIEMNYVPAKRVNPNWPSNVIQHNFERKSKIVVTNGAIKGAMLAMGYEPSDESMIFWNFKIKKRKL